MTPVLNRRPDWFAVEAAGAAGRFGPVWLRAAGILKDGHLYTGPRHNVIIKVMAEDGHKRINTLGEQGFVTNAGRLIDRVAAGRLALVNGQVAALSYSNKELYSEEVWAFSEYEHPDPRQVVRCYQGDMISAPSGRKVDPRTACLDAIEH